MPWPTNAGKAILRWELPNGATGINALGWERQDFANLSSADCLTMAGYLDDWYRNANFFTQTNAALRTLLIDDMQLAEIICEDAGPGPSAQAILAVGVAGGVSGQPLPNETALVTSLYSTHPGRTGRGRTFLPGIPNNRMDPDGTCNETNRAEYENTYQSLIDGLATSSAYQLCVVSHKDLATWGITSAATRGVFHHQRRRNA